MKFEKKNDTKFYYNFLIAIIAYHSQEISLKNQIPDSSVVHFSDFDVLVAGLTRDLDSVIILLLHPKDAFLDRRVAALHSKLNLTIVSSLASSLEKLLEDEMHNYALIDTENRERQEWHRYVYRVSCLLA